jgi:hypothetical protein
MRKIVTSEPQDASRMYKATPGLSFFLYCWKLKDKSQNRTGTLPKTEADAV